MFTGIVRELGVVVEAEEAGGGRALVVRAPETAARTRVGDSVAINGCCLTATAVDGGAIAFHAVPETIARTTLGALERRRPRQRRAGAPRRRGARRALRPGPRRRGRPDPVGRGGGRGAARLRRGARRRPALLRREGLDHGRRRLAHRRRARRRRVRGRARPAHARGDDALRRSCPGSEVNLEADVLAKYVERLLVARR